ncbi:aminotransferase class V-fold PLP-dependent enzyme [Nostoc sp.]|uniref:aminotransferase class V-fold PLP-dependent enzyme n=1 Tax=Nostoc sp. TaxID=1180 RepID=UPI002FF65A9F
MFNTLLYHKTFLQEIHSNDLPHRKHSAMVMHVPLIEHEDNQYGGISLTALKEMLIRYQGVVNYVAVTGVSNVTGIVNPIHDIAELAHQYGAYIVVDGTQMVAHMPVCLSSPDNPMRDIDAFVFSGHKIYAPGSPGVLIVKKEILASIEPQELGGGMVKDVNERSYSIIPHFPDREQAGTPNIVGIVTLASVLEVLDRIDMTNIFEKEQRLMTDAIAKLQSVPNLEIYGYQSSPSYGRVGAIAFNLEGLDHGLVAAVINDEHNIAVRNGCFCAHPYVRTLLKKSLWQIDLSEMSDEEAEYLINLKKGMVRASFGLYTTEEDITALIDGLQMLATNGDEIRSLYLSQMDGSYVRRIPIPELQPSFHPLQALNAALSKRLI